MASDAAALGIVPDYDRSKSCVDVYTRVARAIIGAGEVDLLAFSQFPKTEDEDIPSWVPDWRGHLFEPCGQLPWDTAFVASRGSPFPGISESGMTALNQLKLEGCHVDIIEARSSTPWKPSPEGCTKDPPGVAKYLSEITTLCLASNEKFKKTGLKIYKTDGETDLERNQSWVRVPIADQEQYEIGYVRRATNACLIGNEEVRMDIKAFGAGEVRMERSMEKSSYYNMMGKLHNRRSFMSAKGYVGLGPEHLLEGDVIVILLGAKFPYILRSNGAGAGSCRWTRCDVHDSCERGYEVATEYL
jgi:hypothetical protein